MLTDEEWVRQNFTAYLTSALGYPASVVGNEVALTLNNTRRRADTVVFGRNGRPAMVVEYKAPTVKITSEVFDQIVRYNIVMQARVIVVSNGLVHYCCEVDCATGAYNFLPQIPSYHQLISLTTNG